MQVSEWQRYLRRQGGVVTWVGTWVAEGISVTAELRVPANGPYGTAWSFRLEPLVFEDV